LFSQNDYNDRIIIKSKPYSEEVTKNFSYLLTTDNKVTASNLSKNANLKKDYCHCAVDDIKNFPLELWVTASVINKTKDTLNLVFFNSNAPKVDLYLQSKKNTKHQILGYFQNTNERFCKEVYNCFSFKIFPNEEKKITLHQKIINIDYTISKLNLVTKDKFDEMLLKQYREYHLTRMLFAILLGGLFLVFIYNFLLFLKTKSKNHLYYSLYLFCTLIYIFFIIDKNQNYFLGNLMLYSTLLIELFYIASFVLYAYFISSIIKLNKISKKIVSIFTILAIIYFSFLIFRFLSNPYDFSEFDYKIITYFKFISYLFVGYILILLSKNTKTKHIKYVFIGSLILILSYLLQSFWFTFADYFSGKVFFKFFIRSNFAILLGTILEVSFFTYALFIKSSQINKEKIHLENLSEIKSRFFANISHEFRTPLTLIKSPVQSLQSEISDENQKRKLNLIDSNATRMLELVDQLLQLSKIDSGNLKLILKDGNIGAFIHTIIEPFNFLATEKKLNFTSTIDETPNNNLFDKDVIEKIITNLVSNAFKHTTQNDVITINSSVINSNLKIVVSNSGSNLKKEDLNKIFERFYQKDESQQGFGIGLALVAELVNLYNGTIETTIVSDRLSFIVILPLSSINKKAVVIEPKNSEGIQETNIIETGKPILLIVDDNFEIRLVLKDIFKDDYQIFEAEDGEQALKIAKKEIPDCIISDVMMPKIDGFEFTKKIKNDELTSFIPVILLTARTSDEDHLQGLKSTADAYLIKPFNNDIVKETVNQLITERKKLHQRYSQELVLKPTDIVINSVDEKFIEKLQTVLHKELANAEFSSEDFAKEMGMSRMQLHRKLKSLLGVSATEFLRNERLRVSCELLKKGNANISEIAYAVGFNDLSYFSKCFKEMYNCTPTEYLEKK